MHNGYHSDVVSPSGGGSPLTTKGDVFTYSTVAARLGVGTNGYQLVADSTTATGLKWAAPAAGTGNVTDINADATAVVTLTVGTTGTDFAIVDDAAGDHKFNLPSASATARGLVTTGAQTFAGQKSFGAGALFDTGSVSAPIGFIGDTNTGFYGPAADQFGITVGGVRKVFVTATGVVFNSLITDALNNAGKELFLNSIATAATDMLVDQGVTDGTSTFSGGNSATAGGNFKAYGSTHATKANISEIRSGSTIVGSAVGSVLTLPGTTDSTSGTTGTLVVAGGVGVASGKGICAGTYHLEPTWIDNGNSGTADTIDWAAGALQKSTLTGSVTYTFSNPGVAGSTFVLAVYTGAGSFTGTWPATVKWATAPTVTVTASRMDLFGFTWDGTNYYGSYVQGYTP